MFCDKWDDGFRIGRSESGDGIEEVENPGFLGDLYTASTAHVSGKESKWAFEEVLVPLNKHVHDAASNGGAIVVDGIVEATTQHGFCSEYAYTVNGWERTSEARWFRTFKDSWNVQGDVFGSLHPNANGHRAFSDAIYEELAPLVDDLL